MIAVGVVLILIGAASGAKTGVAPPGRYDWRDLFATLPMLVGGLMVAAGLIKRLWLVAP